MVSRRTVVVGVVLAFPLLLVFLNLNAVSQRSSATATPKLRAGPKEAQAERGVVVLHHRLVVVDDGKVGGRVDVPRVVPSLVADVVDHGGEARREEHLGALARACAHKQRTCHGNQCGWN